MGGRVVEELDDLGHGCCGGLCLFGGNGGDRLDGGSGNDLLNGGGNADRLVFGLDYDSDTIAGFQDDIDTIELQAALTGGASVAQILGNTAAGITTTQIGGSVEIDFSGGDVLRINSVLIADLSNDMIIV